jgi:hypothetical protein
VTATQPAAKSSQPQLVEALDRIERPGSVLDALPAEALHELDAQLALLSAAEREQLAKAESAAVRPLSSLKLGGASADALFAIAVTPAALQELPRFFSAQDASPEAGARTLLVARELAKRAALHFLRDRALEVERIEAKAAPQTCMRIESAARAAELPDLERLALEVWAELAPEPEALARLARARARAGDAAGARAALERLPSGAESRARLVSVLDQLDSADPLARAWAELHLERYERAEEIIAPLRPTAREHLGVAALLVLVATRGSSCPGLTAGAATPRLCALAMKTYRARDTLMDELEAAWQSKRGRSPDSVEAYFGLRQITPWLGDLSLATDRVALLETLDAGEKRVLEALAEAPERQALAVFVRAFAAGARASLQAPLGGRPVLPESAAAELTQAAHGVESPLSKLAAAAVLASQRDIGNLLPLAAPPELEPVRVRLLAWAATAPGSKLALDRVTSDLAESARTARAGSLEQTSLVLLSSELNVALQPSDQSDRQLERTSLNLLKAGGVPTDLQLRAALNAAAMLERRGEREPARKLLKDATANLTGASPDLLTLASAESLVLEWDPKLDPQRRRLAQALAELERVTLPGSLSFVVRGWAGERIRTPAKPGAKGGADELSDAMLELLRRGTLRLTRVRLGLSYAPQTGIVTELEFEPMFVALVGRELILKAL